MQEFYDVDIIDGSCTDKVIFAIFCIVVKFLIGCT